MEDHAGLGGGVSVNIGREEEEDEFCSCCEEEEEFLKESEQPAVEELKEDFDESSVKMFFKGLSIAGVENSSSGYSGIGVFMERPSGLPAIRVQKKLDFYAENLLAEYLALIDGLLEAMRNNVHRVYAFTDSELLYDQITFEKNLEMPLLIALRERVLDHANNFESFVLNLVPSIDLEKPLQLAKVAIGLVSLPIDGGKVLESCSICCEDKPLPIMITMKCSHKFCSHCLRAYVDGKVQSCQVPIRCPQPRCKYYISTAECRSFLPFTSFESLEKALAEANVSDRIYCPFPNCSVLLDPRECLSARASSSSQSDNSCVECPVCQRFICVDCEVPWHSSMSCDDYQNLPEEERDASDITLHRLAQNKRWKRCQQCRRMIELTQGCYHMTCWCGHEFCYSCGAEYRDGQQTCQCVFWDEDNSEDSVTHSLQESEQWAWETFNSLPMVMDAYSDQERSQLALIQRFLAGGFSLSDHHPYQSPPHWTDSYVDAMKDLHQLPWLERFVSVISDNYYEDYIQ
ncbi:E3 ubiquitin-protein ligase RSL1 [Prosopis cineraria]|uniref:E3 ubiquitin-protein ligase RSL1 n=1 Tax=Prosopis cineraria TaxID=364024 RepID=UPI00240FD445|nr:E3 ubiquitin-protein ligase RSL1 [Prosopis cineraria]XP_054777843.1 E3 ubiquitin-protein ligase RSL1 [Prosopis cineraria]XP_054777844.1 E3 ubiquitin-protein ligase RSL1 [Prosopis cineraria]XP_054777846.1 E3 ubiquitin-protein ligase RSL1 [Prosopis cineraria]